MIINSRKFKFFCTYGVILALLCSNVQTVYGVNFKTGNTDEYVTGLKGPTDEEKKWIEQNMKETKDVNLNKIGLERINKARKSKNLKSFTNIKPAEIGQEAVTEATDTNKNTNNQIFNITSANSENVASPVKISSYDLPDYVDNKELQYFPKFEYQSNLGSCCAFATTYFQATYMTALARDWNAKDDPDYSKRFSPKWTYNFANKGINDGMTEETAYSLLSEQGAATWNDFPYDGTHPTDSKTYTAWPTDPKVWENAANYRIDNMGTVNTWDKTNTPVTNEKDPNLDNIKKLLANGYVLTIGVYIESFNNIKIKDNPNASYDDDYVGANIGYMVDGTEGGHAMCVVGYNDQIWSDINNDNIIQTGELGAFQIQDAHSDDCYWMSYDCLNTVSAVKDLPANSKRINAWNYNNTAFWITAKSSYTPTLLGELTINHSKRNQLKYEIGYSEKSDTTDPTITWWTPSTLNDKNGACSFDGSNTASDGAIVLDYANLMEKHNDINFNDTSKRWYMRITDKTADGNAGIIKNFKLVDPSTGYTSNGYKVTYTDSTGKSTTTDCTNTSTNSIDGNSVILSIDYKLGTECSVAPTFSIDAGTYKYAKKVRINSSSSNSTIKYTTNGDTPTSASTTYEGPISINGNMTLKAISITPGLAQSPDTSAVYNAGHLIGDVNADGKVNIADAVLIGQYASKSLTTFPASDGLFVADVNADGVIDCADSDLIADGETSFVKKDMTTHMIGDVNDDEKIDNNDVLIMNNYVDKKISSLPIDNALWAGDVNGDNAINKTDTDLINQYVSKTITLFPKQQHTNKLGDLNGDGKINNSDLLLMSMYINKTTTDFPTADDLWTGDLNGDCVINSSDSKLLQQYVVAGEGYFQRERAIHNIGDANGDGKITLLDYSLILRFATGKIATFPVTDILWTGDVNGDNIIDSADAKLLKDYLVDNTTVFPKSSLTPITVSAS